MNRPGLTTTLALVIGLVSLSGCASPTRRFTYRQDVALRMQRTDSESNADSLEDNWQHLLSRMAKDPKTLSVLRSLFSDLPVRVVVSRALPDIPSVPVPAEGLTLILTDTWREVGEGARVVFSRDGSRATCRRAMAIAWVGDVRLETRTELLTEPETVHPAWSAVKLAVEECFSRLADGWRVETDPGLGARIAAHVQRYHWRQARPRSR